MSYRQKTLYVRQSLQRGRSRILRDVGGPIRSRSTALIWYEHMCLDFRRRRLSGVVEIFRLDLDTVGEVPDVNNLSRLCSAEFRRGKVVQEQLPIQK